MVRKILYLNIFFFFLVQIAFAAGNEKVNTPKNIIIMIGDGMGVNEVYTELLSDTSNAFQRFNSVGFSITCSADQLITDSGAGATALSTGYRTNNHFICVSPDKQPLKSIFEFAKEQKLSTGIVVTCSITHATPAGFVAHVSDRSDEDEIADQYLNSNIDVAIGGGRKFFNARKDKVDLISKLKEKKYSVLNSIEELKVFNGNNKFYAFLEDEALKPAEKRDYALADLVKPAIERLSKNSKGFVLMVEGSQIDWGGHGNNESQLRNELQDFNKAINKVLDFAEKNGETLVVVTGDHETGGLSIIGGNKDGSTLDIKFSTKNHSANAVGVFAYGPGEERFRGIYNNYMIGRKLINLLIPSITWK